MKLSEWMIASGLVGALLLFTGCSRSPGRLPVATPRAAVETAVMGDPSAGALTPLPEGGETAPLSDAALIEMGEMIYTKNCAPCHHPNGEGTLSTFPSLNRNPFVTVSDPTGVIDVVLHGRQIMPAFAVSLQPQEVAAVVSYIRNAWDNEAAVVNEEQVREVQEAARSE